MFLWLCLLEMFFERQHIHVREKNPLDLHFFLLCNMLLNMQANNSREIAKEVLHLH